MSEKDPLGTKSSITRRDFLNTTLLASGAVLLSPLLPIGCMSPEEKAKNLMGFEEWTGYGGVGDYKSSHGNTWEAVSRGHKMRDGGFGRNPFEGAIDTGEEYDVVVIGGGIAGLSSAFFSDQTNPGRSCLILDDHPIFGGQAKQNEFEVDGQHLTGQQASCWTFPPLSGTFLSQFYDSIGIDFDKFEYQHWRSDKEKLPLSLNPYGSGSYGQHTGIYFGKNFGDEGVWLTNNPWENDLNGAPISEKKRQELLIWRRGNGPGGKVPKTHGDEAARYLDTIYCEQDMMEKSGLSRETIRRFELGQQEAMGPDSINAYHRYAAGILFPYDTQKGSQMFPGGNAGVARHLMKSIIPKSLTGPATMEGIAKASVNFGELDKPSNSTRMRLHSTVLDVMHEGKPENSSHVNIVYFRDGEKYVVRAKSVIMSCGSAVAPHLVYDLPEDFRDAFSHIIRAPVLVANVAVRNWRFLYDMGIHSFDWYGGMARNTQIRKRSVLGKDPSEIGPDSPAILSMKISLAQRGLPARQQVALGRQKLLTTPFLEFENQIRQHFTEMFSANGFDAERDIAGIILNRWGHSYNVPPLNFYFGRDGKSGPGDFIRENRFGRITFANSELRGIMDHRSSVTEAHRAAEQMQDVMTS